MGKYSYSFIGDGIPLAPIIEIHLTSPAFNFKKSQIKCRAFLDTGADFTLVPLSLATEVGAKFIGRSIKNNLMGVGGASITYIPCFIGILFEEDYLNNIQVLACHDDDLKKHLCHKENSNETDFYDILVGRDFLKYYKITFDGLNLEFKITKAAIPHPKAAMLASPAPLSRPQH